MLRAYQANYSFGLTYWYQRISISLGWKDPLWSSNKVASVTSGNGPYIILKIGVYIDCCSWIWFIDILYVRLDQHQYEKNTSTTLVLNILCYQFAYLAHTLFMTQDFRTKWEFNIVQQQTCEVPLQTSPTTESAKCNMASSLSKSKTHN